MQREQQLFEGVLKHRSKASITAGKGQLVLPSIQDNSPTSIEDTEYYRLKELHSPKKKAILSFTPSPELAKPPNERPHRRIPRNLKTTTVHEFVQKAAKYLPQRLHRGSVSRKHSSQDFFDRMSQSVLLKASRDESRDADALKITTVDSLPDTREEYQPPMARSFFDPSKTVKGLAYPRSMDGSLEPPQPQDFQLNSKTMQLQYRYPEVLRLSNHDILRKSVEKIPVPLPQRQETTASKEPSLQPSGRISMPPMVVQHRRFTPHGYNLPNLFTSSRSTKDPPPNETKFIESPTPGLSPPHSPVEKMTPSNQFNLLAAEGLDKAVAAPKVAAMHKRFNSSLNQYLEAPIQNLMPRARLNQTLKEVSPLRRSNRPKSSLELLTLTTKFNQNFVRSENMTKRIKSGIIQKPMLAPIPFKFGQKFQNKSQEDRYLRTCTELFKLKTLFINDPSNARDTLMNFLTRFLSKQAIQKCIDVHVQRLVRGVLEFKSFRPGVEMAKLIKAIMEEQFDKVGLKFTEPDPNQQELLRLMGLGTNCPKKFQESLLKKVKVDMPPTTHESLKLPVRSLPTVKDFEDRGRLGSMINRQIDKIKKYSVGQYQKPMKLLSPRQTKLPITVEVQEYSEEIKRINQAEQQLDIMKRNKLVLEHVIKQRVRQKHIENGLQPEPI